MNYDKFKREIELIQKLAQTLRDAKVTAPELGSMGAELILQRIQEAADMARYEVMK